MIGKVKAFKVHKGYGFIAGDDGQDYFFHISQIVSDKPLGVGRKVEFNPMKTKKGLQAASIIELEDEE